MQPVARNEILDTFLGTRYRRNVVLFSISGLYTFHSLYFRAICFAAGSLDSRTSFSAVSAYVVFALCPSPVQSTQLSLSITNKHKRSFLARNGNTKAYCLDTLQLVSWACTKGPFCGGHCSSACRDANPFKTLCVFYFTSPSLVSSSQFPNFRFAKYLGESTRGEWTSGLVKRTATRFWQTQTVVHLMCVCPCIVAYA